MSSQHGWNKNLLLDEKQTDLEVSLMSHDENFVNFYFQHQDTTSLISFCSPGPTSPHLNNNKKCRSMFMQVLVILVWEYGVTFLKDDVVSARLHKVAQGGQNGSQQLGNTKQGGKFDLCNQLQQSLWFHDRRVFFTVLWTAVICPHWLHSSMLHYVYCGKRT